MTFWDGSGSGSADPCLWPMDPDPDPAIFVIDLQDASKKLIFNTIFSAYYFLKVHLHHFSKIKSQKESQNSRNQGFSNYFCMMIEGSGSIPLTSGSGSGSRRPKNMWIRWIRIRIRIRNTAQKTSDWGILCLCARMSRAARPGAPPPPQWAGPGSGPVPHVFSAGLPRAWSNRRSHERRNLKTPIP